MKWFDGGISEAVKYSQEKKALFCVVILETDHGPSTEFLKMLENSIVTRSENPDDIVWIRIDANSEQHAQFSQIYSNATFPSIYCITHGGVPSAVINDPITSNELEERLSTALSLHKAKIGTTPPLSNVSSSTQRAPEVSAQQPQSSSNISGQEATTNLNTLSINEKIERAKKLAAAKQREKLEKEAEEKRRREIERREAGKGASELKRWQQEQEQRKIIEERKKDKLEEQQLRQRLREQIAADRAARNARTNVEFLESTPIKNGETASTSGTLAPKTTSSAKSESTSPSTSTYNGSGKARLQFRLPEGGSHSHAFDPDTTLGQVRQYIIANVNLPFRDFSLWVAFPRKEFRTDQYGLSLRELELFPSSALLILPAGGNGGVQSSGLWATLCYLTTSLMGILLYPVSFLTSFFTGGAPAQIQSRPEPQGQTRPARDGISLGGGSNRGESSLRTRKPIDSKNEAEGSSSGNKDNKWGKDGNVHRLRNSEKDSDDEKTTYNGNSTTQL